jgi:Cof subfamily protein (haloacid dehalogenase superfamily)
VTGPGDIRLLLADVDGTLVTNDKVLTKAAMDAVQALARAGVAIALISSRPPRGMSMLVEPLALTDAMVGLNGALFVRPDLSVLACHPIDPATARQAVDLMLDQGLDVWVYTEAAWLVRDIDAPHVAREAWILKFEPQIVAAFSDTHLARALKIVGVSDEVELVASCLKAAQLALGGRASAEPSQTFFIDVTSPQANKGAALITLATQLDIPPEQIATIGDMPTDVLMFRKSGFSIAMGNASDAVKAQASAVTDSNQNDGFAKAVQRFILAPTRAGGVGGRG